ncbi:MAG: hypothetical protein KDA69_11340 [Planctomycetaceae bacterium]|nr:hypothetical protein [Planctomycetaceae bacterium]MCB9949825.1 hypothetical protein [Planctomycetaceae bacterium]
MCTGLPVCRAADFGQGDVVAELWFLSPRTTATLPEVAVLKDGSVRVARPDGSQIRGQLTGEQVSELQRDLLLGCGLAGLNSQRLATEIHLTARQHGLSASIPNADETVIRVRDDDGTLHEVRCHAVGLLVNRFPAVSGLQSMYRAESRLQNLRSVLEVGGAESAANLARVASESLRQQDPMARPLTVDELAMVRFFPDGSRYIQFKRDVTPTGARSNVPLIVAVTEHPSGPPQVSVFGGAGLRR